MNILNERYVTVCRLLQTARECSTIGLSESVRALRQDQPQEVSDG